MSLRSVTDKIDGLIQGLAVLVSIGIWAAFGFPFIPEVVELGCLFIVSLIVYWWMTSRYSKGK